MDVFDYVPEGNMTIFDFMQSEDKGSFDKKTSTDWKWTFSDYPKEKNGLKVFSCFACGGGSTMGYKLAGCEVIGCLEIDKRMNDVYVKNHNPKHNYLMDIREFNKVPNNELPQELFNLDILDGSPPCTTFSMAGQREESWGKTKKFREGQTEQTLDDLSFVFIETVNKLKPKCVVMENVEGLLQGNAWGYVQEIYKRFKNSGYSVKHYLLKGEEMGIPQKRHRVFFIAVRSDIDFDFESLNMMFYYNPVTYEKINFQKGNPPSEKFKALIENAKPTEGDLVKSWNRLFNNNGEKRMYFNHILCHKRNVFPTVSAGHSCLWNYDNVCQVSSRDIVYAQTFPEDYDFMSDKFSVINYICGMSVPPIMIKRVVERLIESNIFK